MSQTKDDIKNKRLMTTYGITLKVFNEMLEAQGGVCWICKKLPKSGRLCIDHRHVVKYKTLPQEEKCKEVRALLCFMCNTMLHGVEKRKDARFYLQRMVDYFNKFKIKGD
jgi:hypothetical protein